MKRPRLVAVTEPASALRPLIDAAAEAGLRVGWLDLESGLEPPPALAEPLANGAFKAVATTAAGSVAAKTRRGDWVLDDLLREHFLGCRAVLVRGAPGEEAESIHSAGGANWRLRSRDGAERTIDAEAFVRWVRKRSD